MQELNLPTYPFKFKNENVNKQIYDEFRKKYVKLTPEEWVRQNFAHYLVNEKNVPRGLIVVEKKLIYNQRTKRADIIIYSKEGNPLILIECKRPTVKITETTFFQIASYNYTLQVNYLILTNGLQHYMCKIDLKNGAIQFIENIPNYDELF